MMELIYEAATAALNDCELQASDIDAVVIANMEMFEGRALHDVWVSQGAPSHLKQSYKVATGGTSEANVDPSVRVRYEELGRIAELTGQTEQADTPLEIRLEQMGRRLIWITLLLTAT